MIQFNEANRSYYSEDFIKGFNCGAKRQAKYKKIGHWIIEDEESNPMGITYTERKCSVCGYEHHNVEFYKYCPQCGARMIVTERNYFNDN